MSLQTTSHQTLPTRTLSVSLTERLGEPSWGNASRFGYIVILLFFGGLVGWAGLAPLSSGVNVGGTVQAASGIKTVQHYEGGRIEEILVQEGDRIAEGQVLLRMNPLRTEAQAVVQQSGLISILAEQARLNAEVAGDDAVTLNAELLKALEHPAHAKIVESELKLFDERKENLEQRKVIRYEQIAQTKTQLHSLNIRLQSTTEQLKLIDEELASVQILIDKRLTTNSRLLAIKRARTGIIGQLGTIGQAIAQTKQRMSEQQLSITAALQSERTANVGRLNDIGPEIARRRESINVVADQLKRIEIKAPASGRVMNLRVQTIGQVLGGGQTLMEVVPENEEMVVQAKLKNKDIEQVRIGALVKVRLTAFNPRLTPPVDGQVVSVTPTTVPSTGKSKAGPTYGVKIKLDPVSLKRAIGDQHLIAGMPAGGLIAVGEQTLLSYLMTPMISSFEMALREP
jgi:HlyD family type I secretion membrane fusion protein